MPSASSLPNAEGKGTAQAAGDAPRGAESATDAATRDAAKAAFQRAVSMANSGDYVAAKALFLEAYRLVPHPIVAYNAALACVALGERQQAADLLDRALATSEGSVSEQERAAILAARAELGDPTANSDRVASVPPPLPPHGEMSPGAQPSAPSPQPVDTRAARRATASSSKAPTAPIAQPALASPTVPADPRSSTWGYAIGSAGAALLLGSGVIYFWNDARHDTWSKENAALEAYRDNALAMSRAPSQDASLRQRASTNDDLLSSIQFVDAVDIAMLTSGVLALGVGAYLTLAPGTGPKPVQLRAASRGQFRLEYRF